MKSRKNTRGFTLIEVMLVLMILGGLATLAIYAFSGRQKKANIDTTTALMDKVLSYLDEYKLYIGRYPTDNDGGLKALVTKPEFDTPALAEKWCKLAEPKQLKDAWGNDFRYDLDEEGKPRLKSNGPDTQPDSEDDITRPVKEEQ
jgi:general secretion pathway protein G